MSENDKELKVDAIAGLLDFYSDRAEAHASFLVACVFGAFSLLAIVQNIRNILLASLSAIPYVLVALVGLHCLQRFSFYANMSVQIKARLEEYAKPKEIPAWIKKNGKSKEMNLEEFRKLMLERYGGILSRFKTRPIYVKLAFVLIFGLPFVIVFIPKIASML